MVRVRIQAGRLQNVSSVEGQPSTDEYQNPSDFRNKGGVEKNMLRWVRQANGIGKKPDDFPQKDEEGSPEDQKMHCAGIELIPDTKMAKDDRQKSSQSGSYWHGTI